MMPGRTTSNAGAGDADRDPRVHVSLADLVKLEGAARFFDFLPRQPVGSVLSGQRASRLRGRGLDFEDIRAYLPGDDFRSIDWRVTARTGSPHIRVMREERDRPALIVVDQRQAMFFGSRLNMKSVTAAEAATLAAWRIFSSKDRVGGLVVSDDGLLHARPGRSKAGLLNFLSLIARGNAALSAESPFVAQSAQQLNLALRQARNLLAHDGLLLVLSDFDGADDETFGLLHQMSSGNDIILGLIFDPIANEIPSDGHLVASNGTLQVRLDLSRKQVQENLAESGGRRLRRLMAWQNRLDAAILPLDAGARTLPQMLRLFGAQRQGGNQVSARARPVAESHP